MMELAKRDLDGTPAFLNREIVRRSAHTDTTPCEMGASEMSLNELTALLEKLPPELQQEVFDFASYLAEKKAGTKTPEGLPGARVPGLHKGQLTMRDDFDEPLSDDFWLGQER